MAVLFMTQTGLLHPQDGGRAGGWKAFRERSQAAAHADIRPLFLLTRQSPPSCSNHPAILVRSLQLFAASTFANANDQKPGSIMHRPPAAHLSQSPAHLPLTADRSAALGSLLVWTVTLLLTLTTLACRLTLWTAWTILRLSSTGLVYLFLAAILLLAALLMLAFHSIAFLSGNFP